MLNSSSRKLMVVVGLMAVMSRSAQADVIGVNTADIVVADDGYCSLPEAIVAANSDTASGLLTGECPAGSGADTIELPSQIYDLTVALFPGPNGAAGLPPIESDITINGHGSTIRRDSSGPQFRIFEVGYSSSLHLISLSVMYGHSEDGLYGNGHGADGGCFYNAGALVLDNVQVERCRAGAAVGAASGGSGGAIFSFGTITMVDSSIQTSAAGSGDDGTGGNGGAIYATASTTLTRCSVVGNEAGSSANGNGGSGGGIFNDGGSLVVSDSIISANSATAGADGFDSGSGGGIVNNFGSATLLQSTISLNTAGDGTYAGVGGGISSAYGNLYASGCTIELNHAGNAPTAPFGGNGGNGGGIYSSGSVQLIACAIRGNSAGAGGNSTTYTYGGGGGDAGAIFSTGYSTLYGCVIDGNSSGAGGQGAPDGVGGKGGDGAIVAYSGTLLLYETTVSGNTAGAGGGATGNGTGGPGGNGGGVRSSASLKIQQSALLGNHAGKGGNANTPGLGGNGGGLVNDGDDVTVSNSTISGNQAGDGGNTSAPNTPGGFGGRGGGIFNQGAMPITNATISNNSGGATGDAITDVFAADGTGGVHNAAGTLHVVNSIIANSTKGPDCAAPGGVVYDNGGNIVEDGGCGIGLAVDPRLTPLAFHGGPTMTHALCTSLGFPSPGCLIGSPAIDLGDPSSCQSAAVSGLDQRSAERANGAECDSGAFESGPSAPVVVGNSAARPGGIACVPVSLVGGNPTSTANVISLDATFISVSNAIINPAIGPGTAADKQAFHAYADGEEVFSVSGPSDDTIPTGLLYTALLTVDLATPPNSYLIDAGTGATLTVTTCSGDCDGNGAVSLGEAQRCVNMFLGEPTCDYSDGSGCPTADTDNNGMLSLGEVQQCLNHVTNGC